jgi:hypothetical protein
MAPYPDRAGVLSAAKVAFADGKYREVVLADLPKKKR